MRAYPPLTHARLREVAEYDPETGNWMRKARKVTVIRKARPLPGYVHKKSHGKGNGASYVREISIDAQDYRSSRLAYFYMRGEWPPEGYEVDHINNDPLDDRWNNLRVATKSQQAQNKRGRARFKGVAYNKTAKLYSARIHIDGTPKSLGYYKTAEEAYAVYCEVAQEIYGEFANFDSMPKDDDQ